MEVFDVYVRTPCGKYRGEIRMRRERGEVSGSLSFMVFSSDFSGAEDGDAVSFRGSIDTPIGTLDYDARAHIDGDSIEGSAVTRLGTMTFSSHEGRRRS